MQRRKSLTAAPSLATALEYFEDDTEEVIIFPCYKPLYPIMGLTSNRKRVRIHTKCLKSCVTQLLDFSGRKRALLLIPHPSELMSLAVHDSIMHTNTYFPNSNIFLYILTKVPLAHHSLWSSYLIVLISLRFPIFLLLTLLLLDQTFLLVHCRRATHAKE